MLFKSVSLVLLLVASTAYGRGLKSSLRGSSEGEALPGAGSLGSDEEKVEHFKTEYLKYTNTNEGALKECIPDPKAEHINFYLYYNNVTRIPIRSASDLNSTIFNSKYPTKIYVHEWMGEEDYERSQRMKALYEIRGYKVNFFGVDWSSHAHCKEYFGQVIPGSTKVAQYLAEFVQMLVDQKLSYDNIHMIGFGTGAHIVGLAGRKMNGQVGRITGLSPFAVYWDKSEKTEPGLRKGDAKFVDVIHTDSQGYGTSKRVADVDYLVNGGANQPANEGTQHPFLRHLADHTIVIDYFEEAVNQQAKGFIGKRFDGTWAEFLSGKANDEPVIAMGQSYQRVDGTVFLRTAANPPYSLGLRGAYPSQF